MKLARLKLTLMFRTFAIVLTACLLAASCGGSASREQVLSDFGTNAAAPLFAELDESAARLVEAVDRACDIGDATSAANARTALAATRQAWSTTEAVWLGPVMTRRSWAVIDWPTSTTEIEELMADETIELDEERLGKAVGADQRGLGAIEYLLGAPGNNIDLSDRRCDYLRAVALVVDAEATELLSDWTVSFEGGAPYEDQIGADGTTALDDLINDSLFILEDIGDRELGAALDAVDGDSDLERIIEGPAGLATADIAAHLAGLRIVLVGNDTDDDIETGGLRELLGREITSRLDGQFEIAEHAVALVASPLRDQIAADPVAVAALRDAVKMIQITVATEVVSRLGVTIGFSDADGDTGA